ncbi:laminin subunit beta-1-like isoform X1 [Haliotis rufescens]|uniref:laminin subunit beta-1-like isoform X1 n=1 Tax=Haliotis rufescens TaxID=6454 RepID=UPI00201EC1C7|nr:laminin subunit beta-1-like isoform X1 [Haliotis rufescens]
MAASPQGYMSDHRYIDRGKRETAFSIKWIVYCVVFFSVIICTNSVVPYRNCVSSTGQDLACFASSENVENINTTLTVTPLDVTCGQTTTDFYLRLGDVITPQNCTLGQHTKEKMIDTLTTTWWQSKTWPISQYESTFPDHQYPINITLSFNKTYRMSANLTLTFNSGRPQVMAIYKSMDNGATWVPLQYYARDCAKEYPNVPIAITANNMTTVICTADYSKDTGNPKPGGKVDFPGPGERIKLKTEDTTQYYVELENIKGFFKFTDIRIQLFYPATDSKEASRNRFDFLRYYYGISDINIRANCFCNLHAASCMSDLNGDSMCECQHNTAGKDCERCLPLYNNKQWREGSFLPSRNGTAHACEKCMCNDHADSCTFNSTLIKGVCDNCLHNTTGTMCEQCLDAFYPDVSLPLNDTKVCLPCDCEALGVLDPANLKCQKDRAQPNIGQCTCKANVTGRRCNLCQPGFYGLLLPEPGTCKPCGCNTKGTIGNSIVCDNSNGNCPCKTSIEGRVCDKCKAGYYQFPALSSDECKSCSCDPGGSTNASCDSFGMCGCAPHVTGTKCEQAELYFYIPLLDEFILQPEGGTCTIDGDLWTPTKPFDGSTFATCPPSGEKVVEFKYQGTNDQFDVTWPYNLGVRYSLGGVTARVGAQLELTATGNTQQIPAGSCGQALRTPTTLTLNLIPGQSTAAMASPAVTIDRRCQYTLKLTLPDHVNGTNSTLIDSLIFLPSLNNSGQMFRITTERSSDAALYTDTCMGQLAALSSREAAITNETCRKVLYTVSAEVYKEGKPCQCNPVGTLNSTCQNGQCTCAPLGGQCTCKPGVGGRRCDVCFPGYFGLSSSGCTPCDCGPYGSVNGACNSTTGQCKCLQNIAVAGQMDANGNKTDRQCRACLADHYGYGPSGCVECGCNATGTNNNETQCSAFGQCPCKPTISGMRCDACADSYYSFSASGCQKCDCDPNGSTALTCDPVSGVCNCKSNVQDSKCNQCKPGFFNLAGYNPRGCQPCFCFNHSNVCAAADGFTVYNITSATTTGWVVNGSNILAPEAYLGDKSSSYGQLIIADMFLTAGNVSQESLITVRGAGAELVYRHSASTTAGRNVIETRLLPENWLLNNQNPSPHAMYNILSSITQLMFKNEINSTRTDVSTVTMVTAAASAGATAQLGASFVENCTCNAPDNVGGLSCEKCSAGNWRSASLPNDTRFGMCIACDCTGRTFGERQCNETTGVCLNCRNGTTGDKCENCSVNVVGAQCDTCADRFWGLGADGCRDCNCSTPGTTAASLCDKATGQCVCAAHVTGRQCDKCEDNYHNLTVSGCQECDQCYKLVMKEADKLRGLLTNMTDTLTNLTTNDDTQRLGNFVDRVDNASRSLSRLLNFLNDANAEEARTQTLIDQFNSTLVTLTSNLNTGNSSDLPLIQQRLQEATSTLSGASTKRDQAVANIKSIHAASGPLKQIWTSLTSLVTSLKGVQTYLMSLSSDASSQVTNIMATVDEIERVARQSFNRTLLDYTTAGNLNILHRNTTTDITRLDNIDSVLETVSTTALAEAIRIQAKSNTTLATANRLQSESIQFNNLDLKLQEQNLTFISFRNTLEATKAMAVTGKAGVDNKATAVAIAISNSEQQRMNTNNIIKQCDEINARVTAAERMAEDAKLNSEKLFKEAELMRDTMMNFETRALAVEQQANTSLASARAVTAESQKVIEDAAALMTTMTSSQQTSSLALNTARQAKTVAQSQNTAITSVAATANQLGVMSDLGMYQNKSLLPSTINTTILMPAKSKCDSTTTDVASATTVINNATTSATNVNADVARTQAEASRVLGVIMNIPGLNIATIESLKTQVDRLKGQFNRESLTATITGLKTAHEAQTAWLEGIKAKKADLERQVNDMKLLERQIS